jgi:TolB-like protein/tetratricopeptide (TPR) repeat protein
MGTVYRARDLRLGRTVALKFVRAARSADREARDRLLSEARAASSLDHPNIGVVHEVGESTTHGLFMAMACYEGETLKGRLSRGPVDPRQALSVVRQVAEALAAAHRNGIVHGDVKPSNIIVVDGDLVKLVDFGIARRDDGDIPGAGTLLGTTAYMSPEQTLGKPVDGRSDIWSLGVVLYELLAGRHPFRREGDDALIDAIRDGVPKPIGIARTDIGPELASVLERCLAKHPGERYASSAELAADLQRIERFGDGPAAIVHSGGDTRRRIALGERSRRIVLAAAVVAVIGVGALAIRGATSREPTDVGPPLVAVAPFENRTGDPALDPLGIMAADWIIQGLSGVASLRVIPVTGTLSAASYGRSGRAPSGGAGLSSLIASETGAGTVVEGAYYREGDSIQMRATIVDARHRRVMYALDPVTGAADRPVEVLEAVRRLVTNTLASHADPRVRNRIAPGGSPPEFSAYRDFVAGLERYIAGDNQSAIRLLDAAFAADTAFATALVYGGIARLNQGNPASVDSIVRRLESRRGQLSELDLSATEMLAAFVRGDPVAAYRAQQSNPRLAPGSLPHWGLANAALGVNRPHETIRISRELDPERGELRGWFPYWATLGGALHRLGDHREELRVARRALSLHPEEREAALLVVRALAAMGRINELRAFLDEQSPRAQEPSYLLRVAGMELIAHGHDTTARALVTAARDQLLAGANPRAGARASLAQTHAMLGDWDESGRLYAEVSAEHQDNLALRTGAAVAAARLGRAAEARATSDWMAGVDRPFMRGQSSYARARIAAALGDLEESVRLLREATLTGFGYWNAMHAEPDLAAVRKLPSYQELVRPKG